MRLAERAASAADRPGPRARRPFRRGDRRRRGAAHAVANHPSKTTRRSMRMATLRADAARMPDAGCITAIVARYFATRRDAICVGRSTDPVRSVYRSVHPRARDVAVQIASLVLRLDAELISKYRTQGWAAARRSESS